jgi:hypothetical protein
LVDYTDQIDLEKFNIDEDITIHIRGYLGRETLTRGRLNPVLRSDIERRLTAMAGSS